MDSNELNVVDKKKYKQKYVWNPTTSMYFIDLCLNELKKGNKPGTHLNTAAWSNLTKEMMEKTGKVFEKKQLSNKWESMKREWKLYDRLMRLETGIGGTRSLIDASEDWWNEKINVNKDFGKFRNTNLAIFETHYAPLFQDSVVVGDHTMTPLQFLKNSNSNDVQCEENIEGKGDSDEINLGDDEALFSTFPESSSTKSKRKKSKDIGKNRSTKSKTSYEEKLDVVLDALSTKSTQTFPQNNPSPAILDCIRIVTIFPGFEEGSPQYSQALLVLTKKTIREAFMIPATDEEKLEFLKLAMK